MRYAAAIFVLALLSGCATSVLERDKGVFVGNQGDASEVVFSGAGVVTRLGAAEPAWEDFRRDHALSSRRQVALTATSQWPTARRPSLDHARQLYLRTNARSVLYFSNYGGGGGASGYIGRPSY